MPACSSFQQTAHTPPADQEAAQEAARAPEPQDKPSRAEIEAKVAAELKELGEKEPAPEEKAAATEEQKEEVTYDIPITINAQVERWIDYFQKRIPKRFRYWLERSGRYKPMMQAILREHGLPEDLIYLAMIESGFSCSAYSRAHACGPWQFISATGRRYGLDVNYWVDERRDPVKATHAAAQYLTDLYAEFGSWYLAAAGYNAGEAKIRRALKRYKAEDFWQISHHRRRYLKRETKNYVPKMIAAALIAKEPEKYGFKDLEYHAPMAYDQVRVHGGTSLAVAAKLAGIKVHDLSDLNPELRRWCTPPNRSRYTLRIPAGRKAAFETAYAKLPAQDRNARIGTIKVKVRRGDTLGRIARTYRVGLRDLMALNHRVNPRRLQIGQTILVPPTKGARRVAAAKGQAAVRSYAASKKGTRKLQHVVRRGDTLWDIAQAYGISHRAIKRWNGRRSSRLYPGQKLVLYVPQAKAEAKVDHDRTVVYVVRRGDNLWDISRRFRTTPAALKRWNGLHSNRITPGDRLTVRLADNS
jgi:membrane-bound lytic murein transglycosylase D